MQHTNRLAAETSPYLLQHAHNPVDWFPWGPEALQLARDLDKPILVSIGYAACHWCHVMEKESFENEDTASFMNEHFVNIKIDREERPDLDHIYMDAVQAIAGNGGWPLNVFLTPTARPFYGGTYFPPVAIHNRPSWKDLLAAVHRSFREKREEVERQAESLTRHIGESGLFGTDKKEPVDHPVDFSIIPQSVKTPFNRDNLQLIFDNLMKSADRTLGGFGQAPKFPQSFSIRFLLHYYHFTKDNEALDQACLSLDKMIEGGIYDQLGGGFARYSTDEKWLVPHFEKMLYDNALLVITLSEAFQLTGKDLYKDIIHQTMAFIRRDLSFSPGEGQLAFYAALDADSEGEEGKYYIWSKDEIQTSLGADAPLFERFFGVTEHGNWEGRNILTRDLNAPPLSGQEMERLQTAMQKLLTVRYLRIPPALDDKALLGWNALMNLACSKAYSALGTEEYRDWAIRNMDFCLERYKGKGIYYFYHTYKGGEARFPAFLDDYAGLVSALLSLQEITGNAKYLIEAKEITEFVITNFSDEDGRFFYFTHKDQQDVIVRKKEIYDGAVPSGNSVMAVNLSYMSIIFNEPSWARRAVAMAKAVERPVTLYPGSFGIWATLYQALTYTIPEIVITAKQPEPTRKEFLKQMIPYRVFQSAEAADDRFPLLSGKPAEDTPLIFLCKNYACQLPVNEVSTLVLQLENVQKFSG